MHDNCGLARLIGARPRSSIEGEKDALFVASETFEGLDSVMVADLPHVADAMLFLRSLVILQGVAQRLTQPARGVLESLCKQTRNTDIAN